MTNINENHRHCTEQAAADFLRVKVATIRSWRFHRVGPVYAKFSKAVRCPVDELNKFAAKSRIEPAAVMGHNLPARSGRFFSH